MEENKKNNNQPFSFLKVVPFERPKLIGQNTNYFAILLNIIICFCRLLINFHASKELTSTIIIFYHIATNLSSRSSQLQNLHTLSLLIGFIANILLLLDSTGVTTEKIPYGGYVSRMTFARFASFWGINSHCLRLGFLSVSFYSSHYSLAPLTGVSKIGMDQAFLCNLIDGIPLVAICFYSLALIIHYGGMAVRSRDEVSNPWIEDWESRREITKGKNIGRVSTFLIIGNIAFLLFFITFFTNFKFIENEQHFEPIESLNIILPLLSYFVITIDVTYRMFVKKQYHSNHFVLCGFFTTYYLLEMHIELESQYFPIETRPDMQVRFMIVAWTHITILCFNGLTFVLLHPLRLMNFVLWFIKWSFSLGGVAVIFQGLGSVLFLLSGWFASYSFLQEYIYINIHLCKLLKDFIQFLLTVFESLVKVIDVIMSVISIINNFVLGSFCIIIFILVQVVAPILVAVGFNSANPVLLAAKGFKNIMGAVKVLQSVKSLLPFIKNASKFTAKGKVMEEAASNSAFTKVKNGGIVFYAFQALGACLFFISLMGNYYYSAERYTEIPSQILSLSLLIFLFILGTLLGFVYLTEFIFARTYDLIILTVDVRIAWGFVWFKFALIVMGVGIVFALISSVTGRESSITKTDHFRPSQSIERFVFPSLASCLCPLFSFPENASKDTNICLVVCNRVACFLKNKEIDSMDDGNTSMRYVKELICPCIAKEDLRPDLDQPIIANLCFNLCCCCFYDRRKIRQCHPVRCCFFLQNYMRMQDVVRDLERPELAITAAEIPPEETDYQEAKSLEQSITYEKEISQMGMMKLAKSPVSPHDIKKRFEIIRKLRKIFSNGFYRFPSYLTPLFVCAFGLYFAYRGLKEDWDTMSFFFDADISSIVSDTGTEINSGHNDEADSSRNFTCPLLDLFSFVKDIVLKVVFSALIRIFPQNRELLIKLQEMVTFMTSIKADRLFQPFMRFIVLVPAVIYIAVIFAMSVLSSFIKPLNRIMIIIMTLPIFSLYGYISSLPPTVAAILENIPFLNVEITMLEGYWYAEALYYVFFVSLCFIFLDNFMPPIIPKIDSMMDSYVKHYDDELNDVLMN